MSGNLDNMEKISTEQSPGAIVAILGQRLKLARLNANMSQEGLATKAGVSRPTIVSAENGRVQLESFVAIIQALNAIDQLDLMFAEPEISPLQLVKMQGKRRARASKKSVTIEPQKGTW
jgi:putative transcriptional regulator